MSGSGLSRRQFLVSLGRTAGRLLLLAGLGAAGAALARRGRPEDRTGETCINGGLCRGCAAFAGCGLPQALSARERAPWARGGKGAGTS